MVSIVLADKHTLMREGLLTLLEQQAEISILGETGSGVQVLVAELKQDILISGLLLPLINDLEVVKQLCRYHSRTHVIILSAYSDEKHVLLALASGARGYAPKASTFSDLMQAITTVYSGKQDLNPSLPKDTIQWSVNKLDQDTPCHAHNRFTPRKRQIFQLVAEGHTSLNIGDCCLSVVVLLKFIERMR